MGTDFVEDDSQAQAGSRTGSFISLIVILLLLSATAFLFRGWLQYGMQMDEVARVINVIPLFNPEAGPIHQVTFSVNLLGLDIPLTYKEYMSTAYTLRYLPLGLFDDYLFGLRALYWFYFVASAVVLYLVVRRHHLFLAAYLPLLMVTHPLYYPEIRAGSADALHVLFISIGFFFLYRFLRNPESGIQLFLGILVLAFAANQRIFMVWIIAGAAICTLVLFPEYWYRHLARFRNLAITTAAVLLGLANFVLYNLLGGFPTLSVLYNRYFNPKVYNQAPLDYSEAAPLLDEMMLKLSSIPSFLGPYWKLLITVDVIATLVLCCCVVGWVRHGDLKAKRLYLLPFLTFGMILSLILISPKTTRAGHYVYVIPFQQLTVLAAILLIGDSLRPGNLKRLVVSGLAALLVIGNFLASDQIVRTTNKTSGVGLYSPAVFDFNGYLIEHEIDSNNVLFLTWGLYAQPYFLQKGDFHIKQFAYQLIEKPTRRAKQEFLKQLFTSALAIPRETDSLYFPLWAHYWTDTNDALVEFVDDHGGQIGIEKTFEEKLGGPAILLYRLDGVGEFVSQFHREVIDAEVSPNLTITRFGPTRIPADNNADLPMWFIAEGLTPHTRVGLQGLLLQTVNSDDHVTALVPRQLIGKPGFYPVFLYDPLSGYRSEVVLLQVE